MDELLHKLRIGSLPERVAAAKSLAETGDPRALSALREALKRLREPYEETVIVPGGWGNYYDKNPEQVVLHDPDREIREAINAAMTKLESDPE